MRNSNRRSGLLSVVCVAAFLLTSPFQAFAEVRLPNGEWVERVEDLRVKVLGGFIVVERTWQAERQNQGEWRWHFNPAWDDLKFEYEHIGESEHLKSIRRAGAVFQRTDDEELVFAFDRQFFIRKLEDGRWRWYDRKGNWIDYEFEEVSRIGRITAYGDRNNVRVSFTRTSGGKLHQLLDHHGQVALTYSYVGNQTTITDRAGREVKYRYTNGSLTEVEDVRGNAWKYGYSNKLLVWKEDPEGRRVEITYSGNRVVQIKDAQSHITQYSYEYDRVKREYSIRGCSPHCSHAGARRREYLYDFEGRLLRSEEGDRVVLRMLRDGPNIEIRIDERNARTIKEFDSNGNPIRIRYPDGVEERFKYEPVFNQIIEHVNRAGIKSILDYDNSGNLLKRVEAYGGAGERITYFTYDNYGQQLTKTIKGESEADDVMTKWTYDSYGNVSSQTNGEQETYVNNQHHITGQVEVRTDPRGEEARFEYLDSGQVSALINPLGYIIRYEYDRVGNRTKIVDPLLNEIVLTYTENNWLASEIDPQGGTVTYVYRQNPYEELEKKIDPEGAETLYEYDNDGRLVKIIDEAGNEVAYEYGTESSGLAGLLEATQSPTYREEYRYDLLGRVTKVTRIIPTPENEVTYYEETTTSFDNLGQPQTVTDPLGRIILYSYDRLGRLKTVTDAAGGTATYAYDNRDNLISVADGHGHIHKYEYDKANRLVREERPLGQGNSYDYDEAGNLRTRTNAKGERRVYGYDDASRRISEDYYQANSNDPSQSVVYVYDERGLPTGYSQTGDTNTSAVYVYNSKGVKIAETVTYGHGIGAFSRTIGQSYFKNNQMKQLTYPDGKVVTYTYDDSRRISRIGTPSGDISYANYVWQKPVRIEMPGVVRNYTLDVLLRPTQITVQALGSGTHSAPDGPVYQTDSYIYDRVGNLIKKTPSNAQGEHYRYTYDTLGRLIQATPPESLQSNVSNPGGLPDEGYAYDFTENRIQSQHQPGPWQYNENNELLSRGIDSDRVVYEYDANGQTIRETKGDVVIEYFYDAGERLREVRRNGNSVAIYQYDPLGRRVKKKTQEKTTWFQYSDQGVVAEYSISGSLQRAYGWLPPSISLWGTDPIFLADVAGTVDTFWRTYYFHNNYLGTPQLLTDQDGNQVWEANFEAFGGTRLNSNNVIENPLRFPGQYEDKETGLFYNYHRYYDKIIGRYIGADPAGIYGGINIFAYAHSAPTVMMDPYGLRADCNISGKWLLSPRIYDFDVNMCSGDGPLGICMFWNGSLNPFTAALETYADASARIRASVACKEKCYCPARERNWIISANIGFSKRIEVPLPFPYCGDKTYMGTLYYVCQGFRVNELLHTMHKALGLLNNLAKLDAEQYRALVEAVNDPNNVCDMGFFSEPPM